MDLQDLCSVGPCSEQSRGHPEVFHALCHPPVLQCRRGSAGTRGAAAHTVTWEVLGQVCHSRWRGTKHRGAACTGQEECFGALVIDLRASQMMPFVPSGL